ncbi:biopolymer transporter ExbD [Flavobacterium sp. IR1]|nr:biopolymer transporter ExbD [Flavobacterium sp. IR1]
MKKLSNKVRSKKLSTRVDLTAMVSISFLLIIFFMVVGELSKPKSLALGLPDNDGYSCGGYGGHHCSISNRTVTLLLGSNNKLITYTGLLQSPIAAPKEVEYGQKGIRQELSERNKMIMEYEQKGIVVIIKPSKNCNFKNLVDILDEMDISKIDTYAIVDDYTPEESKLLASK